MAAVLVAAACTSHPHPPPLSAEDRDQLAAAGPTPLRVEVRFDEPDEVPASMHGAVADVVEDLRRTALFAEVARPGRLAGSPDLRVLVHTEHLLPYYATPGHHAGVFVPSLVVPFWWSETCGYRLTVEAGGSGEAFLVDTTGQGDYLLWASRRS